MVNELPLARQTQEGQSVLLARGPDGSLVPAAYNRNKRTQISSAARGVKVGSVEDAQRQSKSSRKIKRANAGSPRPKGHRRNHTDRKQNRRAKGADSPIWRSAQLLGITFPGSYCHDSTAHHWLEVDKIVHGSLFRCIYCHKHIWLPLSMSEAVQLGTMIKQSGDTEGYCRFLNQDGRGQAKILMAELQELERISQSITDAKEMAKIAAKILDLKNYDRR